MLLHVQGHSFGPRILRLNERAQRQIVFLQHTRAALSGKEVKQSLLRAEFALAARGPADAAEPVRREDALDVELLRAARERERCVPYALNLEEVHPLVQQEYGQALVERLERTPAQRNNEAAQVQRLPHAQRVAAVAPRAQHGRNAQHLACAKQWGGQAW